MAIDIVARPDAGAPPPWRTLEYLSLARLLVSIALVLSFTAFGTPLLGRLPAETAQHGWIMVGAFGYFVLAVALAFAAFFVRRNFTLQVVGQLLIDMTLVSALLVATGGLRGGMMILYLLPLAGASLLLPTVAAFFVCAVAVLALLVDAFVRGLQSSGGDSMVFQTGLFGAALFGVTGLLRLLSARLAAQERLAQLRGRDLESQLEINRLVIAQMEQGVLVVDTDTRVRANNRAARALLGLSPDLQLTGQRLRDLAPLRPLADAFSRWLLAERPTGVWSNTFAPSTGQLAPASHAMPNLQLRARFARPPSERSDEFVVFLEDLRALEERAQQLKLASMGRLTASIAHEIRNPLAAISHAGQLLGEETQDPLQLRLAGIVRENTLRLNRLVDDVLRVARREPPAGEDLELAPFVQQWFQEFTRDRQLAPGVVTLLPVPGLMVRFEPSHLRQVLYNLVDNGLRYASGKAGSVQVAMEAAVDDGGRVRLWVFDDGPGVVPEARAALFEPFYTTHARGTGLGLYIAREFCIANRSDLTYGSQRQLDGAGRDGFVLRFARRHPGAEGEEGFLDTMPVRELRQRVRV
jgi:two-component system sensor histidine kinase PilS (NtrC family)